MNTIDFVSDESGIRFALLSPTNAPANLPSAISTSTRFILIYLSVGYDRVQVVITRNSNVPYLRYGTGNPGSTITWTEWKEL